MIHGRCSLVPTESGLPAGFHFTGDGKVPGVTNSMRHNILDQIGLPLEDGDTITLPPETMRQLQGKK